MGQTEQFTTRIDSRLYHHIEQLAVRERRSRNEIINILLKLGLIELSKKKSAARSTPPTAMLTQPVTNKD